LGRHGIWFLTLVIVFIPFELWVLAFAISLFPYHFILDFFYPFHHNVEEFLKRGFL